MKHKPKQLPLTHALAWIVGSTLIVSGGSYAAFKHYLKKQHFIAQDTRQAIRSIVQTGPQKEALKTEYFAELLGISDDRPPSARFFDVKKARERLCSSPLIARAEVKILPPNTLYIDYTVRQPIAWLEDYDNLVIDHQGYPFPFTPYFSPKNLPAIYIGLSPFGIPSSDPQRPTVKWGTPVQGKYIDLSLEILAIVSEPKVSEVFTVKRIDVSNAFAESYGTREIVVVVEDVLARSIQGKEVRFILPRILRLSTKNFAKELGNYLKLREQLMEEERKTANLPEGAHTPYRLKEKVIDLRLNQLAFIE